MPVVAVSISHTHSDNFVFSVNHLKVPRGCWTPSPSPRRARLAGTDGMDAVRGREPQGCGVAPGPEAGRGKPRGPRSGEGDRGSRGCWGRGGERPQPGRVRRLLLKRTAARSERNNSTKHKKAPLPEANGTIPQNTKRPRCPKRTKQFHKTQKGHRCRSEHPPSIEQKIAPQLRCWCLTTPLQPWRLPQ